MNYIRVFLRGLALVTLVACNSRQIAAGHIGGAVVVGGLISVLWWQNSSRHRPEGRWMALTYGAGAACGTGVGYFLAEWLGRF